MLFIVYRAFNKYNCIFSFIFTGTSVCGDTADSYCLQVNMVQLFAKQCHLKPHEFRNVEEIHDGVPSIKFYHVPSKYNCVVTFNSEMSVWTSKLIKYVQLKSVQHNSICHCLYIFVQIVPVDGQHCKVAGVLRRQTVGARKRSRRQRPVHKLRSGVDGTFLFDERKSCSIVSCTREICNPERQ